MDLDKHYYFIIISLGLNYHQHLNHYYYGKVILLVYHLNDTLLKIGLKKLIHAKYHTLNYIVLSHIFIYIF